MYAQPTGSIADSLNRLRNHLIVVPEKLASLPASELTYKLPGKWSKKELLGHLIDSAINNLKRFADAQQGDGPYLIQRYNPDHLVAVNHYQTLPLTHLLNLWASLNQQIVYLTETIPLERLARPVYFGEASGPEPEQTLSWLIEDYVAHLEHHLKTLV